MVLPISGTDFFGPVRVPLIGSRLIIIIFIKRYLNKIKEISSVDPYELSDEEFVIMPDKYPSITYPNIVNYFVFGTSPFTSEQIKVYKGLMHGFLTMGGIVKEVTSVISFINKKLLYILFKLITLGFLIYFIISLFLYF